MKKKKKTLQKTGRSPPTHLKTFYFPCSLLLCNVVIYVKDLKAVQFKRKFHYIIYQEGNFSPLSRKKDKVWN